MAPRLGVRAERPVSHQEGRVIRSIVLTFAVALALAPVAFGDSQSTAVRISNQIVQTWTCQSQLGVDRTPAAPSPWAIGHHSRAWHAAYLNKWVLKRKDCATRLRARADALRSGRYDLLPDHDLYAIAAEAIKHGGVYSMRWGDASPILKGVCYEAVRRTFARYGTDQWAIHIVNRESGCNPGAVNTTYSSWSQRAQCIAQLIPQYHQWVDYSRCKRDLRYAVEVFVGLSNGGRSTGPWSM